MRTFIAILLFLSGLGLIGYSYIGSYLELVREVEGSETFAEVSKPIETLFDYLMKGGAPRVTSFLYTGALLIVISVVMLVVRRKPNDERDSI